MAPLINAAGIGSKPKNLPPSYAYANAGPMGAAKWVRQKSSGMMGRASTILTGGLGDVSNPDLRVHSLLGN